MTQTFVQKLYRGPLLQYGPQRWWPITTVDRRRQSPPEPMTERAAFEIAVGAILTQSTSWNNVELALCNLKRALKK
ncbi:MAG: hypothetical protein HY340_02640 [Candidatus Kerfeldbacteria bacterium]|nr:hypothetical protein [Candidatus Kerfeldbacteria bacterium]